VALTLALGLTAAVAAPAHAQQFIMVQDGFEASSGFWKFQKSGVGNGGIETDVGYAREGRRNGWLTVESGWSSVGRPATLRNGTSIRCSAWIYVQTPGATLNVEIIDPATWNYIALETHTVASTGSGYTLLDVGPWRADIKQVQFRVAVLAGGTSSWVRLDDMGVQCWFG
jgi:hypothetical protein